MASYLVLVLSNTVELGSLVIKSIEIDPYACSVIGRGSRSPYSLCLADLLLVYISHSFTVSFITLFIFGNIQYYYTRSSVFLIPRYPPSLSLQSFVIYARLLSIGIYTLSLYYIRSLSSGPARSPSSYISSLSIFYRLAWNL